MTTTEGELRLLMDEVDQSDTNVDDMEFIHLWGKGHQVFDIVMQDYFRRLLLDRENVDWDCVDLLIDRVNENPQLLGHFFWNVQWQWRRTDTSANDYILRYKDPVFDSIWDSKTDGRKVYSLLFMASMCGESKINRLTKLNIKDEWNRRRDWFKDHASDLSYNVERHCYQLASDDHDNSEFGTDELLFKPAAQVPWTKRVP